MAQGAPHPLARLLTDPQLARMAAAGDRRAFATIYERHASELYRYCRSIVRDPDDAADALQSTMAAALRALPGERRDVTLKPWLFRIAHNESISLLRRRRPTAELSENDGPASPGPERTYGVRERLSRLISDLGRMPERQRGALLMRELSGLTYDEIAVALEVSSGAARQAVYAARVALAEIEQGRDMACAEAQRQVSLRDRRVLRGRRLNAHLHGCSACHDFNEQMALRRSALRALIPPLPIALGGGILAAIGIGGAAAAGGISIKGAAGAGGGIVAGAASVIGSFSSGAGLAGGAAAVVVAVGGIGLTAGEEGGGGSTASAGEKATPAKVVAPRAAAPPREAPATALPRRDAHSVPNRDVSRPSSPTGHPEEPRWQAKAKPPRTKRVVARTPAPVASPEPQAPAQTAPVPAAPKPVAAKPTLQQSINSYVQTRLQQTQQQTQALVEQQLANAEKAYGDALTLAQQILQKKLPK